MEPADSWERLSDALLGPYERDILAGLTGAYRALEPRIEQAYKRALEGADDFPLRRLLLLREQLGQELSALRLPPELAAMVNTALRDGQQAADFWALAELRKVRRDAQALTPEQAAELFANAASNPELILSPAMAQQNPSALIAAAQRQGALAQYAAGAKGTQAFAALNRLVEVDLRGRIIGAVEFHLAQGDSWRQLRSTLQQSLELTKSRAQTVARTEMAAAMVEGSKLRYEAEGIEQVQWQAVGSSRTCGTCAPRHGKVYRLGEVVCPAHPNCVLGDSLVATGTVIAATRSIYRGNLVTIRTRNGALTVTANHPMATQRGWVKAMNLRQGDYLVRHLNGIPGSSVDIPNLKQAPSKAEDLFNALLASSPVPPITVPAAAMQFHGDGVAMQGQIDVVFANRELQSTCDSSVAQLLTQRKLIGGNAELLSESGLSPFDAGLLAINAASCGLVGLASQLLPVFKGQLIHAELLRLSSVADSYPQLVEPSGDDIPAAAQLLGECLDAGAGVVERDEVLMVNLKSVHEGVPVYDFTTASSAYIVDSFVAHNCRCTVTPWDERWLELGLIDPQAEAKSRADVLADLEAAGKEPLSGPSPFERALGLERAPEPLWTPPRYRVEAEPPAEPTFAQQLRAKGSGFIRQASPGLNGALSNLQRLDGALKAARERATALASAGGDAYKKASLQYARLVDRKARANGLVANAMQVLRAEMLKSPLTKTEITRLVQGVDWSALGTKARLAKPDAAEFVAMFNGQGFTATTTGSWIKKIQPDLSGRGWNDGNGIAAVRVGNKGNLFHELTHTIEMQRPQMGEAAQEWASGRAFAATDQRIPEGLRNAAVSTVREKPVFRLNQIEAGSGYKDPEIAWFDDYLNPYMGKYYPTKVSGASATEVWTMAVEHFANPSDMGKLARKHPDLFQMVVGLSQQT